MQYKNQIGTLDCAFYVIQNIHWYFYKNEIKISSLKKEVNFTSKGINLKEISRLLQMNGIETNVLEGDFNSLSNIRIKDPILTIIKNDDFFHYVVIEQILKSNKIIYYDPLYGRIKESFDSFKDKYLGIIVTCSKKEKKWNFKIDELEKINIFEFDFIRTRVILMLSNVFLLLVSFLSTFYIKIVIDNIVPSALSSKLIMITFLFILLMIVKAINSALNDFIISKIKLNYLHKYVDLYIKKLSTVKIINVLKYDESMHLRNLEFISIISAFKTRHLINLFNNCFSLFFSTIILVMLNATIFFISLVMISILILITNFYQKKFKLLENQLRDKNVLFSRHFLNLTELIEYKKFLSCNSTIDMSLKKSFREAITVQTEIFNKNNLLSLIQIVIKNLIPFLIVLLSVFQVWKNNLSPGQIFLYLSIFNFFINPIFSLTFMIISIPIMKQYQDEINYFLSLNDEESGNKTIDRITKIELKDINFSYPEKEIIKPLDNLLIDQKLIVKGLNSSGKSTLLKIISSIISDQNIFYNDIRINELNLEQLRKQIIYISSNEKLINATVYEYLCSKQDENREILLKNIEKYNLHKLLDKANLSLHTKIQPNSFNLSQGQKELIIALKIFAHQKSLILFDESFENIDRKIREELFEKYRDYLKDEIVIEVSHQNNYIFKSREFCCEWFK